MEASFYMKMAKKRLVYLLGISREDGQDLASMYLYMMTQK